MQPDMPGDVAVVMKRFEFPSETVVPAGATLFVRDEDTHPVERLA